MVKKEKWFENPILYIVIVILAAVVWMAWPSGPGLYDEFAACLSGEGVVMYGTEWCSHCKAQKELFGKSFELVNYVDCDFNKEACLIAGVEGYPTWKIGGENYPGEQSFERLASLSGCEFNSNS